jgi:hypothetical protein
LKKYYALMLSLIGLPVISRKDVDFSQARKLIEAGFEYVCEIEDVKLFRKHK